MEKSKVVIVNNMFEEAPKIEIKNDELEKLKNNFADLLLKNDLEIITDDETKVLLKYKEKYGHYEDEVRKIMAKKYYQDKQDSNIAA